MGVFLIIHFGTKTLSPMGQELVGGIASLVTVAMIAGMLYWMRKSSKDIAKELEGQMEEAVGPAAVFTVAFLAVGREGIETILLIFDSVTSTTATPFIGLAIGIACAVALGLLMYRGVLAINFHVFFQVIALLLVFVGAGIMRYGIHDLQEAGVLPGMDNIAFDASSWWVPGTWYASLMEGMFNIRRTRRSSHSSSGSSSLSWAWSFSSVRRRKRIRLRQPSRSNLLTLKKESTMKRILAGAMCAALALPTLTACADKASNDTKAVKVSASDDKCELDNTKGQTGINSFSVTNPGKKVTEFYVIDDHGRVQGEVENIGPGASRNLSLELRNPGKYTTQCKPGMVGDGIKGEFTVSRGKIDDTKGDPKLAASKDAYRKYARSQAKILDDQTKGFVTAINDGNVKEAKAIYPRARTPYERIEPVAESFPNDLETRASTPARPTLRRVTSGLASTASRRTCGPTRLTTTPRRPPPSSRRTSMSSRPALTTTPSRSPPSRSPAVLRACSTRLLPPRSPARRTSTPAPTCTTSRPTSRALARRLIPSRTRSRPASRA